MLSDSIANRLKIESRTIIKKLKRFLSIDFWFVKSNRYVWGFNRRQFIKFKLTKKTNKNYENLIE